ncbi:MAG: trigger factor [bacterium]
MVKNIENISETKKRLQVEIPADVIETKIQESLGEVRQRAKIPGFRQGKVPVAIIEKRYGQQVESEVVEKLVSEYYAKAIEEAKLHPVAYPAFEKTDFTRKHPLEMTFTVEVMPEIGNLQYEGIVVRDEDIEVAEEEVESVLMRTRAEHVKYESLDRPVEDSDLVTLDYDIVEESIKREGQVVKVGSDQFPKELSEQLRGKSKGDTFEVVLTFPGDHPSEFKGKTLTFTGSIKEIKVLSVPDLNDEFSTKLGYQDIPALKEAIRNEIVGAKKTHLRKKQIVELIEKLVDTHDFPVPESMLESEIVSLLTAAKTKEENKDKDDAKLREELLPEARRNAKAAILLNIIGKRENISVTEEDMKEKILELSRSTFIPPQNLIQMYMSRDGSLEGLRYGVYREKVADRIHAKAKVEKGA